MSELMRPIPFNKLMDWVFSEYHLHGRVFGVRKNKFYKNKSGKKSEIFGKKISSIVGPAAGPNSQLAQNIIASYLTGSRFMEVKTVQFMDGEDLRRCIQRPCISSTDEIYNIEWSTEFYLHEAMAEYIKAWVAIDVLRKEFEISDESDVVFNMSVGYTYDGISSPKVNRYLDGMMDATHTDIWKECMSYLNSNIGNFKRYNANDLKALSPHVSNSVTLSTLHGCPPEEIEKIANYLLKEKGLNTYIKCNPTLLGYEFARDLLDKMGYSYISFTDHHFKADLQIGDAVVMLKRLMDLGNKLNLSFGVKITNTFPVKITNNELPGEEMYMAGRSLFPLSINVALLLSEHLDGKLPMSFSGGADYFNIDQIMKTGIQPITVATTILQPGGYERFKQLAEKTEPLLNGAFKGIDIPALRKLAAEVPTMARHIKETRETKNTKADTTLGLFDCYIAPCKSSGCPINQQIPEYVNLVDRHLFDDAFKVIQIDNALPAVTGAICDHQCQSKCTRVDYESSVAIRNSKKAAVQRSQRKYIESMVAVPLKSDKKVVVIGAGPAGIAAAYYLRRNGIDVTVKETRDKPYGIVQYVIPEFRISNNDMALDYDMAVKAGAKFEFNVAKEYDVEALKKEYDYVIIATGAWLEGASPVKEGKDKIVDALEFLEEHKSKKGNIKLGERVAVIGSGDVAMDCARAAIKTAGVKESFIVYRRTEEFMPANAEERKLAKHDGVIFKTLLAPVSYDGKNLVVEVQEMINERDSSGRKKMRGTGKTETLQFDTVIGAVGARVCTKGFTANGIALEGGYPKLTQTLETNIKGVYVAGDCKQGPATIVKAMADIKVITKDILAKSGLAHDFVKAQVMEPESELYARKGVLKTDNEKGRCLTCDQICEVCTDVCPNRANISITVNSEVFGMNHQIVHIDGMCNECGNCYYFCPHSGDPCKDKVTLFWTEEDFHDSHNVGFLPVTDNTYRVRNEKGQIVTYKIGDKNISAELREIINAVRNDYAYLHFRMVPVFDLPVVK